MGDQPNNQLVTREEKVNHIVSKFRVGETIEHLHNLMKEVTKKEVTEGTVHAACQCVCRLNETIDTAIKAARFISDR